MMSGHGTLRPLAWRPRMVTGAHPNEEIRAAMWKKIGTEREFPGHASVPAEPDINPNSNYIHDQRLWLIPFSHCTEKSWASFQKAFLLFKESLQLHGGSSFGKRKTHSSSFLHATDNTLLSLHPPHPNPQKESGEMCHVPHDAHSYGNEDSRCRFFFLQQSRAEVVRGCITCQHLHPVEASWQWSLLKLMLMLILSLKTFFSTLQLFHNNVYLLSL